MKTLSDIFEVLKPAEIAAFVGAAAWAPHLWNMVRSYLIKPLVIFIPESSVQIGFTTLGPIFNLNMAIGIEQKDAILDGIYITIKHENGDNHILALLRFVE